MKLSIILTLPKIWLIILKLTTLFFLISLIFHIIGRKSFLSDLVRDIRNLRNKKMLLILILISIPVYPIIILPGIVFFILLLICILSSLALRANIYPKEKNWRTENYGETNIKISRLLRAILEDFLINSHNRKFNIIYNILLRNKKDYKDLINNIAFKNTVGIPKTFLEDLIVFCKKYDDSTIKKIWYIRIRIKIRRLLSAALRTINRRFEEEAILNNIKIIVGSFRIRVNGLEELLRKISSSIRKSSIKGVIYDLKDPRKKPHVVVEIEDEKYTLTTSKKVNAWGDNIWVKTVECGKTNKGDTQYALHYKEGEGFPERYLVRENLSKEIIKKFGIEDRNTYIGRQFQHSLLIQSKDITKGIEKGRFTRELNESIKKKLDLSEKDIQTILKTEHKKIGEIVMDSYSMEDKFYAQRGYYNRVEETKKDPSYFDKD